jgi:hypothetical protein
MAFFHIIMDIIRSKLVEISLAEFQYSPSEGYWNAGKIENLNFAHNVYI